ncbi:MAG: hypothetical protein A2Y79_04645 [Deltaproteobacteria bacterium RBG_13_43_22]|nr:MAG: hypothetical protein A2Y79_04645 [Deltaproteobacteria bacterium RBG_13_43_22]
MAEGISLLIDTTKCIACRGCQVACKQWNQRAAEKTVNHGNRQNPPDLSFNTWKLVRFSEIPRDVAPLYFFPDQCRHCLTPSCKEMADLRAGNLITIDKKTGAVIFNQKTKLKPEDFEEIREACPYDIPRFNSGSMQMAKCTLCFNRTQEGIPPACVKTCPTGGMQFGNRQEILDKANKRLAEVRRIYKHALLVDPEEVRVIYLLADDPRKYYHLTKAENKPGISRKVALKQFSQPLRMFRALAG